jgi:hypothetical protein
LLFVAAIGVAAVVGVNDANHPRAVSGSSAAGLPRGQPAGSTTIAPAPTAPDETLAAVPPLPRSAPVRVEIPAIGVDSTLVSLGLQADGTLQVPPAGVPAGWYAGAPTPGERGPAIIVGHVDWGGRAGVFYHLHELKPDDQITITRADGSTATFRVTAVRQFPKDQFPSALVYGNLNYAGLRLITCSGAFDPHAHSYQDNTVVFAELASASPA